MVRLTQNIERTKLDAVFDIEDPARICQQLGLKKRDFEEFKRSGALECLEPHLREAFETLEEAASSLAHEAADQDPSLSLSAKV